MATNHEETLNQVAPANSKIAWSCVLDDTPAIWSSFIPWLATMLNVAHADPHNIFVHHVCELRPEIVRICADCKVNTRRIECFDPLYPHTNKITQCKTSFPDANRVVLTDVDMVCVQRSPIDSITTVVAGKLVDRPNPPLEVLQGIFKRANIPFCATTTGSGEETITTAPGNLNGGLYIVDARHISRLGVHWAAWARWLITHISLMGRWRMHVDQVAFCLAVHELNVSLTHLDNTWNFPLHLPTKPVSFPPYFLHHHAALDQDGCLITKQDTVLAEAINTTNRAIEAFRRRLLDQQETAHRSCFQ